MRTAIFQKQQHKVMVRVTENGSAQDYFLEPGRDVMADAEYRRVIIKLDNSDRTLALLPEEIDFEGSTPDSPNTTDLSAALGTLSADFFFDVNGGGGTEITPQPAIPDDDGSDTQGTVNLILDALRANNIILT